MTQLTGRVLNAQSTGWDEARVGFAEWAPYNQNEPQVIVFCQDTQDVVNAINWARENKVPLRARSGRHNYEAYSSLNKGGIIIDVSEIDFIRAEQGGTTATVGAGLDMVTLVEGLNDGLEVARPGNRAGDVAAALYAALGRAGIEREGRCGYPIGLSYPPDWGERTISFRTTDDTILEAGMTFHFMPGLWMADWGLEITESILIRETGPAECLASVERKLFVKP